MPRPLHEDAVRLIKKYRRAGYSVTNIAKALKVSRSCVSDVVNGRTHMGITDDPNLPPLRKVSLDRTPIRADGRTEAEAARPKSRGPSPTLRAVMAEQLRRESAERVRIRALSEPAVPALHAPVGAGQYREGQEPPPGEGDPQAEPVDPLPFAPKAKREGDRTCANGHPRYAQSLAAGCSMCP